ncbi:MAG: outer membrane protein assembly factor BamC [bacterium]
MNFFYKQIAVLLTLAVVSGCGWIDNYDRREKYLEAEMTPKVSIPEGLDDPPFVDALVIPDVMDLRGISGRKLQLGLPEAISTTFGIEQIVIKKLGKTHWIFLDVTPATVWPKLVRFIAENNIELDAADPRNGVLETIWVTSVEGEPEDVIQSIVSGEGWADSDAKVQHKFKLSVEPGIRSGSSEVHLKQRQIYLDAPVSQTAVDWEAVSDNEALESALLTKLAYFFGETINEPVFSIGATALRESKAKLLPDREKPVLVYKLAFDRAWATVGGALENARIDVEDLDRTSRVYFVYYDESVERDPGFFTRLFTSDEKVLEDRFRYQVHLESQRDEVLVTVLKDTSTPADSLIAERLLRIIKESST